MADLRDELGAAPSEWSRNPAAPLTVVPPADDPAPTTQSVQGVIEGAPVLDDTNSIEFMGERFKLAENVGMMPLIAYANASKQGLDSDDMEGMAAMFAMIRDCIHRPPLMEPDFVDDPNGAGYVPNPKAGKPQRDPATGRRLYDEAEWNRFYAHATDEKAEGEDLSDFIGQAMGIIAARPRKRRGISSTSSPQTSPSSRESSSSPVTNVQLDGLTPVANLGR